MKPGDIVYIETDTGWHQVYVCFVKDDEILIGSHIQWNQFFGTWDNVYCGRKARDLGLKYCCWCVPGELSLMHPDNLEVEKKETCPSVKITFVDKAVKLGNLLSGQGFMLRGVVDQVFLKTNHTKPNAYCINDGSLSFFPTDEEVIPVDIEFVVKKK